MKFIVFTSFRSLVGKDSIYYKYYHLEHEQKNQKDNIKPQNFDIPCILFQ